MLVVLLNVIVYSAAATDACEELHDAFIMGPTCTYYASLIFTDGLARQTYATLPKWLC